MTTAKRTQVLRDIAAIARDADRRGDVVARKRAATAWRELATLAEAARAPRYLDWYGRK
jgi:hypothetical protein